MVRLAGPIVSALCFLLLAAAAIGEPPHPSWASDASAVEVSPTSAESALLELHNALVRRGKLPGPFLSAKNLWQRLSPSAFKSAVKSVLIDDTGAVVLNGHLSLLDVPLRTERVGDLIKVTAGPYATSVKGYSGYKHCGELNLTPETATVEKLSTYIRCSYAEAWRAGSNADGHFLDGPSWSENIASFLTARLSELVQRNVLAEFRLAPGRVVADLKRPSGVLPLALEVGPWLSHPTVDEAAERVALEVELNEAALESIVILKPGSEVYSLDRGLFDYALSRVQDGDAPSVRRELFLSAVGEKRPKPARSASPEPVDCPITPVVYPSGMVTPANNKVAHIRGNDWNGIFSGGDPLNAIVGALSELGYDIAAVGPTAELGEEKELYCRIKQAETWLVSAHGSESGTISTFCYPNVEYGSHECCQALINSIKIFRPDASLTCAQLEEHDWAYNGFSAHSSGEKGCGTSGGSTNRCVLSHRLDVLKPQRQIAAVHTAQCYGGGTCSALLDGAMDTIAGSSNVNRRGVMNCLFSQLKKDIKGDSRYCLDLNDGQPRETYDGGNCKKPSHVIFPPLMIRSGQGSLGLRDISSGSSTQILCGTSYNQANGLRKYSVATLSGNSNTLVEYAPAVTDARLHEESVTLLISFSSAVDPGSVVVNASRINAPPYHSGESVIAGVDASSDSVAVKLRDSTNIMSRASWDLGAEEFEYRFGRKQSEWHSFVEIDLQASAPNGVALRGNAGGGLLWPDGVTTVSVPPSLIKSGRGGSFKVKIPVLPENVCCSPNLEIHDGKVIQNGCSCTGSLQYADQCVSYGCCWPNGYGSTNCALTDVTPESCNAMPQSQLYTFRGQFKEWGQCCSSILGCDSMVEKRIEPQPACVPGDESRPTGALIYQYKRRPYDVSEVAKCPPITLTTNCVVH